MSKTLHKCNWPEMHGHHHVTDEEAFVGSCWRWSRDVLIPLAERLAVYGVRASSEQLLREYDGCAPMHGID
jgi:hypothetical protein